jgi:hypothetical protein
MTKRRRIEAAAMADMTPREVRMANDVMNRLAERHDMCEDCAPRPP